MNGLKTLGIMATKEQQMGITSYYIEMDDHIFIFHGLADSNGLSSSGSVFDASATGFNRLSDKSKIDVSPEKISVRLIKTKTTLQKALNTFGVPEKELENLAILNGMKLTDELDAGKRIKIIS